MEKVNKTARLGAILIFLFPLQLSQSVETPKQQAFSSSYTAEAKGGYSDAIKSLSTVYEESDYPCNLRMGWLQYLNKDYLKSVDYYKKATALRPYAIEAKFGYIKPLSALQKWDEVLAQYNEILKIDPQNTQANYWSGTMYYNRKDYKTAIARYEKVVNLYPFDYDSSLMLAWSYLADGRNNDAKSLFNNVLLIAPGDSSATSGLKKLE
jgi:tetratricopeptide (TPR) repeat protein